MNNGDIAIKREGIIRCFFTSMLCAFGGWCVLIMYSHMHFYLLHRSMVAKTKADFSRMGVEGWQPQPPSWWAMPGAITTFSLLYVAAVWLLFVVPLFCVVKPSSWLWKWPLTAAVFGAVGALTMLGAIRFQMAPIADALVWFAALTGGTTGLFCSIAKRRHQRKEKAEQDAAGQPPLAGVPL